jgi:hypothetical protein
MFVAPEEDLEGEELIHNLNAFSVYNDKVKVLSFTTIYHKTLSIIVTRINTQCIRARQSQ